MSANTTVAATPSGTPVTTPTDVPTTTTTTPQTTPANTPATSSTPTTSPAAATTPQSGGGQTTTAAAATTTPAASASLASASSAAAPATSSSSLFTTQVPTTYYSTDPGGSIVYVTTSVSEITSTPIASSTVGTTSHTGVIVGAVVGGVAGIAILVLLFFCIRRRARKDEFDGNFDPDRVVGHIEGGGATLPHVDMADEVTPFPQSYTDQGSASMRQFGGSSYAALPPSLGGSGQASSEFYPPGAGAAVDAQPRQFMQSDAGPSGVYLPPVNLRGTGPQDWHTPHPGVSPPPSTVSNNTTSTRAAKEREALGHSGQGLGLSLATQHEAAEGSGDVVVHQDGGRAPAEEQVPPREIPPAYESIPQD